LSPTLAQVLSYPLACGRLTERVAKFLVPLNLQGRFEPETGDFLPAIRVDSISTTKQAVLTGGAIAWAPLMLIREELNRGIFHEIPLHLPWAHLNYGFITLRDRALSLSARAFMDEVRKIEANVVMGEKEIATLRMDRRRIWKSASKRRHAVGRANLA
jgi:DNA-binding transcriptional LysR family regulator